MIPHPADKGKQQRRKSVLQGTFEFHAQNGKMVFRRFSVLAVPHRTHQATREQRQQLRQA